MVQMAGAMDRQQREIDELNARIETLEVHKVRANMLIKGVQEVEKENCKEVVQNFIKSNLKINTAIPVSKAYRVGKGKNRAMLVTLTNPGDKGLIYSNAKNLQGKVNHLQKAYKLDDQLPLRLSEQRQKHRDTVWRNKTTTVAYQLEMSFKRGKLIINNKEYCSQIYKPKASLLLSLKDIEILELNSLEVKDGMAVEEGTSKFRGYVADAKNFVDVNSVYEYVKFHNMDARHIICACLLGSERTVQEEEYEDDNEHGAGRRLLAYMKEAELFNRVICVTRHYDGTHIGPKRFDCILEAARHAVNQKPYNRLPKSSNSLGVKGRVGN